MSRARIIADLSGGFGIDSGALSFGTDKENGTNSVAACSALACKQCRV